METDAAARRSAAAETGFGLLASPAEASGSEWGTKKGPRPQGVFRPLREQYAPNEERASLAECRSLNAGALKECRERFQLNGCRLFWCGFRGVGESTQGSFEVFLKRVKIEKFSSLSRKTLAH